jgi:hypothetical protein
VHVSAHTALRSGVAQSHGNICQLALHFADYQRSSPLYGPLIHRTSLSNCAPSPCGRLSRPPTTTSAPPVHRASGPHSLRIPDGPSPVHMSDSNALVRLPVAVFTLACRKSMQTPRVSDALHVARDCRHTFTAAPSRPDAYLSSDRIRFSPVKPYRRRRHFSPQTRINRFVFLNLPILSLETHLGVTTSPHAPFPAGYVTRSMCNRSPPLRLSSAHRSGLAFGFLPPLLSSCITDMLGLRQRHPDASRGWAHHRQSQPPISGSASSP